MLYIKKISCDTNKGASVRMTGRKAFLSIAIIRAPPRNRLPHAKQLVITGILPLTQAAVNRRNYEKQTSVRKGK
jgi:hypothetical protein